MFNLIKIISNLLNINNKEKIEEEKSDETNIKYIYINKNMILDGVKYEIGKRYHSEIEFKNSIYDFNSDLLANMKDYKIIKIKIFDDEIFTTKNFKIIEEINYKQFKNSKRLEYQLISIVKNKEEKLIKNIVKVFDTDCIISSYMADAIINSGLHKYLDNKIYESIKEKYGESSEEIRILNDKIIKQKSRKYISNLISNESYHFEIAKTGIDKYLDYLINNSNDDKVLYEISKIGRYQDLDYFLKNISKFEKHYKNGLLTEIAYFGNDGHLDSPELIESNAYSVYNELFHHGRIKDLNEMKNHMQVSYLFDFDSVKFPW